MIFFGEKVPTNSLTRKPKNPTLLKNVMVARTEAFHDENLLSVTTATDAIEGKIRKAAFEEYCCAGQEA